MNNKGFTLIEMLVVVAIILALSVSAGLSADFSMKKALKNEYKDTMWDVFKAADIYSELSDFTNECSNSALTGTSGCTITIQSLITKGLLDEGILKKNIPIYSTETKFTKGTELIVKKTSGVKEISLKCSGTCTDPSCTITMNGLSEYHKNDNWGNCT